MDIKLDKVETVMEERGITAEDINRVVTWGEGEGGKLVDGDKNLAKKRLEKVLVYVEYSSDGTVNDVYSHRVTLGQEV